MTPNDAFRVKDFYLTAFLIAKGQVISQVQRAGQVCWFTFANKKECEELAESYWKNDLVPINTFVASIRSLKDVIFMKT